MPDNVISTVSALDGDLVALLDSLRPGDWLALASGNAPLPDAVPTLSTSAPLEAVAEAVFSVLPISRDTAEPLLSWSVSDADPDIADLTAAVRGLARDGSGRALGVTTIDDTCLMQRVADAVSASIRVSWNGAPFLFLACAGGGAHEPTDLARPRSLAAVC